MAKRSESRTRYFIKNLASKRGWNVNDDATTNVSIPSSQEFVDSAIELSSILRSAKIEAPLRPIVLGSIITAMYRGEIDLISGNEIESINKLVSSAILESIDLDDNKKGRLINALYLTNNEYDRLAPKIQRMISILKRLNIRSVLKTDADFLGLLYEAFLRYGYDNNALGIVFTPRHITKDCFDKENRESVYNKFTRGFLNPPFSQAGEPERDFIDAAMDALEPSGLLSCVVKAGIFADDDNALWRKSFLKKHTLVGVISLPEDLFYPTAVPTSIIIAKAHIPMDKDGHIFMGRIWNDGFVKLKGKRISCEGSQIPEIEHVFMRFIKEEPFVSKLGAIISAKDILNGQEFSPQQWLPQPKSSSDELSILEKETLMSIFQTITAIPDISDEVLLEFPYFKEKLPKLEYDKLKPIDYFFDVYNGKSSGEKNYIDGSCPYISSGDLNNSVIRLVLDETEEVFSSGGVTVTAFGKASIQPWRFMARGNGGSSVRVLIPKYSMTFAELSWFVSQINMQRWRFFYGRMAIKSRISKLVVSSPKIHMPDGNITICEKIKKLKEKIEELSQ